MLIFYYIECLSGPLYISSGWIFKHDPVFIDRVIFKYFYHASITLNTLVVHVACRLAYSTMIHQE